MRVHCIYLPVPSSGFVNLVILAVGLLAAFAIGAAAPTALYFMLTDADSDPPVPVIALTIVGAVALPVLWIFGYARFRHRRLYRPTRHRTDRLARVFRRPDAETRLPHRLIEYLERQPGSSKRRLRNAVRNLPPGTTVAITDTGYHGPPRGAHAVAFEPVPVDAEDERTNWLVYRSWVEADSMDAIEGELPESTAKNITSRVGPLFSILGVAALAPFAIYEASMGRGMPLIAYVLAATILGPMIIRLFVDRTWWIIPGGVVRRSDVIGTRGTRLSVAKPSNSPLLVDARYSGAIVVVKGQAQVIQCNNLTCSLLLATWISGATPPTDDELESLLGGHIGKV